MRMFVILLAAATAVASGNPDLWNARDRQDRATLDRIVADSRALADKQQNDATAQYRLAIAESVAAEVAIEQKDKAKGREFAESGMKAAEKAVALNGNSSEYNRILGTLCGQMISSQGLAGLKYGNCALKS